MNSAIQPRNPGPAWGYRFLRVADRVLPEVVFRPLRMAGTWVALALLPAQRRHSHAYLAALWGRPPRRREVWRHFFAFTEFLMLKLRVAGGRPHRCTHAPSAHDFSALVATDRPALFGTFHFGHSELLGFILGEHKHRRIFMIRQRVGNAHDTDRLGELFGRWVSLIWVNDADNLLFALKEAVAAGGSIALKCDRVEFSAKLEPFRFLGARRLFPFTIYHLALIFQLPVLLSVGVPGADGASVLHSSPLFEPDPAGRAASLERGRAHFQAFLGQVEALLRADPFLWFNFIALNPPAPGEIPGRAKNFPDSRTPPR